MEGSKDTVFEECALESLVPTYTSKNSGKLNSESVNTKKLRVKLIGVLPKKKYMVANTTVEDFQSLFGGVVDNVNPKNHFFSVLQALEKEFWEETSHTISINFQNRKLTYQRPKFYYDTNGPFETEDLPFVYVGVFNEYDTIFVVIYIPKISNDLIDLWNRQIRISQERLMKKIFEGWNITTDKVFEVNRVYHKKLMRIKSQYSYMPKTIYTFICSKLEHYYHFLEKTGIQMIDELDFFDKSVMWEWNTMNSTNVKTKINDLLIKTGVQIN
jgi:hypothetical protein